MKTNIHIASAGTQSTRKVTALKKIAINFRYPLETPATFEFKNRNGFTLKAFVKAVRKGYRAIYDEAESYGVWGHGMWDLVLEGIEQVEPGVFNISVGS